MKFNVERDITNRKIVAHGGIYSTDLGYDPKIIDFSSNVNPLGYSPSIKNSLKEHFSLISVYPDSNSNELRKYLQKYTSIPSDQIVVGNGATEIIYNFCRAFLKRRKVLIPIPTFGEYESAARLQGASVHFLKTMNLNNSISKLQKEISKKDCVFICNPNNPTGVLTKRKDLLRILESAYDKSVIVFLDECFIELVPNSNESLVSYLKEFDNLFILRSLTKSFGLAGLRIGYGLGSKRMIEVLHKLKIPWNVNGIAQKLAIKALSDVLHLKKTRKIIAREGKFLRCSISKIDGFTCYPSHANFILIKTKMNSKQIQKKLLKRNILIRDCSTFRGLNNNFIRIAIRTHKENLKLIEGMKRL